MASNLADEVHPARVCQVCGKSFKYPSQLRLHRSVHSLARPFPCSECGRTFKYASTLAEHEKTHGPEGQSRPHVCDVCGRRFAYRSNFRAHLALHDNQNGRKRAFQCDRCPAAYYHRSHLREHLAAKHSPTASGPSASDLDANVEVDVVAEATTNKRANKKPKALFSCGMCSKSYKYRNSLLDHLRGHRNQRRLQRPVRCTVCQATFDDVFKLRQHVELDAEDVDDEEANPAGKSRRHRCCKCGRTFSRRCHLALHAAAAHRFKRRHVCQSCGKSFLLLKCLRQHEAWVHNEETVGECSDCGKRIRGGATGMRAHAATHAWRRQMQLEEEAAAEAGQTRQQKQNLQQHHQQQQQKQGELKKKKKTKQAQKENEMPLTATTMPSIKVFRCELCNKQFPRLYNLQRHQLKMHDNQSKQQPQQQRPPRAADADGDARPFSCDQCGRGFRWERNLKAHVIALHSGGGEGGELAKPFSCGQCDKKFASQARLDQHARSHSDTRAFACKQCDCAYKHKKNLLAHVARCHQSERSEVENENDEIELRDDDSSDESSSDSSRN